MKEHRTKTNRPIPMVRINSRIKQNQHKYIKSVAKKNLCTEGEVLRAILAEHIKFSNL